MPSRPRPRAARPNTAAVERRGLSRTLAGLAILVAAIVVAFAGWLFVAHPRSRGQSGPIVLISIDTLRADHLPAYGYRGVTTPAIDALAADGVVFERAYAHAPQTLPSHTSILTGQLPFEHGVRDNVGFTVKPGQRLLAGMLAGRGYTTAGFASSFILRKETGIGQGFQVYNADTPPLSPTATFGTVRRDGSETLALAEQWLDKQASPRFFLFLHFYEPHRPYRPPERFARYPNPYDGTIAYVDELVGRLAADLKARGLYEGATIALISDHGEGLGDHGEQEHGVFLYDSTMHVPFIVKLPGERDAGKRVAAPVEHIDLVPTLLDFAGAPIPRDLRGKSLRAAMDGSDASLADRGIYSETLYPLYHFGWSPLYGLTDLRYRFIRAPRAELYDLARDAGELHNLQAERAQTATSMQAALDTLAGPPTVGQSSAVSATDLERFQALGYIGSARTPTAADAHGGLPDPKDKVAALEAYRQGIDARSAGHLADAASAFRRVLADNPSMVDVWVQLSAVLLQQGMTAQAVEAQSRAVQLDPGLADNQVTLASAEFTLGRLDAAAEHARLALGDRPGVAHELLARIALARGNEPAALEEARLAAQADPTLAFPLYVQGVSLARTGKYDQALPLFERTIGNLAAHHFEMQDVHLATADALAHLGRNGEAEVEFREEMMKFPQNPRARIGLAMLYRAEGRVREANDVLADMVRTSPTPDTYAMAARTLQILGEPDAARDIVARGLQQFPGNRELKAVGTAGTGGK
jgi:arylsulfatase A-like enzyme/Tfp pilus assembly protein PilF